MKKLGCAKCGGAKKSYKSGGQTALAKVGVMNENLGTSGQYGFARKGGIKKMQVAGAVARTTPDPMYKTTTDRGDYNTPSRSGSTFTPPPSAPGDGVARKGGAKMYKKGGATKKAKLAAMAPPKGKITRADIITAAKRNARKK